MTVKGVEPSLPRTNVTRLEIPDMWQVSLSPLARGQQGLLPSATLSLPLHPQHSRVWKGKNKTAFRIGSSICQQLKEWHSHGSSELPHHAKIHRKPVLPCGRATGGSCSHGETSEAHLSHPHPRGKQGALLHYFLPEDGERVLSLHPSVETMLMPQPSLSDLATKCRS